MRAVKAMRELLAANDGPYEEVFPRTSDPKRVAPLKVRGVEVHGCDYVLCLNEDEATKDRHDREAIVAALRDALHNSDTALVGNKGYRRYLKNTGHRFEIDEEKTAADARYDGKWVLTTNTGLDPRTTALAYKHLWMVESLFRSMKSVLETRPVYVGAMTFFGQQRPPRPALITCPSPAGESPPSTTAPGCRPKGR
jgi:hypothetical protein